MSNVRRVYPIPPSSKTIAEAYQNFAEPLAPQASKSTLCVGMAKEEVLQSPQSYNHQGNHSQLF